MIQDKAGPEMEIDAAQWKALDDKYRIRLHNSLLGGKPVHLVGTASEDGVPNLAVFNSACHVSSNPPLIGMMCRPLTVRRDTYANIKATGQWTLNAITADFVERAHRAADKLAAELSEFDHTGLTISQKPGFSAPAVAESPVQIGLELREELELKSSGTVMLIGEVAWLRLKTRGTSENGSLQADNLGVLSSLGLDAYAEVREVARFRHSSSQTRERSTELA